MDVRIERLATVLVDHSARVQPGDRVLIETTTAAEPLVRALYSRVLERGGYPQPLLSLPDQEELYYALANEAQLDVTPPFLLQGTEAFESRIRIDAPLNTRALSHVDAARQARHTRARAPIQEAAFRRGAAGALRWVVTLFPTTGLAMESEMGLHEYEEFVYRACHVDESTADPVAFWKNIEIEQKKYVERIQGHDRVHLRGPDVDLTLSIKGRRFNNSHGRRNMPDGEVFTGPVEESVSGWVRFTYPAVYQGRVVEGVELRFEEGRVVHASSRTNQDLLNKMLESDAGARYLGEFAIGTNYQIDRFTRNILFDEKIGGTFHMALGNGYPETGSVNKSVIHWDMICDLRTDSEIAVDGEVVYRNGVFI